jgi:hypothetical protein
MGSLRSLKRIAIIESRHYRFKVLSHDSTDGYPSLIWREESINHSVFNLYLSKNEEIDGNKKTFWSSPALNIEVSVRKNQDYIVGFYRHEKHLEVDGAIGSLHTLIDRIISEKTWQSIDFPFEWTTINSIPSLLPKEIVKFLPAR